MTDDMRTLTDAELIRALKTLTQDERASLVAVLRHLAEFDDRSLATKEGFPSLFYYCLRELRLAEGEAARRIHAARAAAKYAVIYRALERGRLSLTTVSLLAPHLNWANHRRLIRAAMGRTRREVEALVADLIPTATRQPIERVRFVGRASAEETPATDPASTELFAAAPDSAPMDTARAIDLPAETTLPMPSPLPARRVYFSFTADETVLQDVERAKELLRHKHPGGKLEAVFAEALRALLKDIDPERRTPQAGMRGVRSAAKPPNRAISRRIRDAVWRRDGGRCMFKAPSGQLCGARGGLEVDHVKPFALGGASDDPRNLRLLCRAHNALEARRVFGDEAIDDAIARRRGGS